MNNREKAAEVIRAHGFDPCREPECIAQDLADAGRLAPDLPGPARRSVEGYHTAHPWAEWDAGNNHVMALKDGLVVIQDVEEPELCITMPPDEAREAAHALLAAANYSEDRQK